MKKILSLGVAAAVVSLTAVAASAAIAPAFDTDAPVAGETLTVQVVANGMTQEATTFTVNASEGLTLTANEAVTGGIFSTETNKFAWAGTAVPADGTVLLTLTYTVDAAADSDLVALLLCKQKGVLQRVFVIAVLTYLVGKHLQLPFKLVLVLLELRELA